LVHIWFTCALLLPRDEIRLNKLSTPPKTSTLYRGRYGDGRTGHPPEHLPIPQALQLVADLEEALTNHPVGADSLHLTWLGRLEEENP
jgi:hypothetical protein